MNTHLEPPVQIGTTLPANGLEYTDEHQYHRLELKNGSEPTSLRLVCDGGDQVGILHFGPPMRFEGDCDASAKLFFEHVCRLANQS